MSDIKHCQCEHVSHFDEYKQTPNGNFGHRADAGFHLDSMVFVKTTMGTFHVCPDCAKDCLEPVKVGA